ncbi:carbon starvation CstA family protein [Clostridium sp. AWRP]|uniref:carbon starvation CstA family protein n=1 Tax=Clostridium sp. AWRP TaxID=2212991 RepID=UPI000FD90FB5|nr:carbon starvation CstA family protein [Clostridium sp. AWRP]AZV56447.1 carbon starvation protein A [Clostridium sp. AWRP]
MYTFVAGLLILLLGYLFYSKYLEKQFDVNAERKTPAYTMTDGVDYVAMPTWKLVLIQFLNIAGLGPIFGAIQGALFGPVAFLWVMFGCVLGGAVHDYSSGMISLKNNGASLSEIHGKYLGKTAQSIMRILTVFFCMIVGIVFITGPAGLLAVLTPHVLSKTFWVFVIIIYYLLATLMPIDVIIGKIYPLFGLALLFMAVGVTGGLIFEGYHIPELTFANLHPNNVSIWPNMFVTIACGAVSGYHATQSPLVARCMKHETDGRKIFYGSMILEGVVAMVWVAAGLAFYGNTHSLAAVVLGKPGAAGAVYDITKTLLGPLGSVLAMLGVIACPITTGDTSFRAARIGLAEIIKYPQDKIKNRLVIAVPMFIIAIFLSFVDFPILWRYMTFLTQAFAMVTLWACSIYLYETKKNYWITVIPAIFMTAVSICYILQAKEGFRLNPTVANVAGILVAIGSFVLFYYHVKTKDVSDSAAA